MSPNLRLQVFLSRNGVCSRRKAFDLIQQGHVKVNNKEVLEPSTPVNPAKDKVSVDGKDIKGKTYEYVLLNKPKGCVTTKEDRHAEQTVLDLLPKKLKHLVPVGRLDKETEGLLLLTNDGDLTYKLTHPKFHVDKQYLVLIGGRLLPAAQKKLERGFVIDGKKTAPCRIKNVKLGKKTTELLMSIHEGRKRQIRLMMQKVRHRVLYLKRLTQGPLMLGTLKTGDWRYLSKKEIESLRNIKGIRNEELGTKKPSP